MLHRTFFASSVCRRNRRPVRLRPTMSASTKAMTARPIGKPAGLSNNRSRKPSTSTTPTRSTPNESAPSCSPTTATCTRRLPSTRGNRIWPAAGIRSPRRTLNIKYKPHTRWDTRTEQTAVPITRRELVPVQGVTRTPVTTLRMVDVEQTETHGRSQRHRLGHPVHRPSPSAAWPTCKATTRHAKAWTAARSLQADSIPNKKPRGCNPWAFFVF